MSILSRIKSAKDAALGQGEEQVQQNTTEWGGSSEIMNAIPMVLGTALLSATIVLVFLHYTSFGMPKTVTFDIIKYVNAQRAVASKFMGEGMGGTSTEDATTQLMSVSKHTREAISEAAGPNTVVVISQSIISGNTRDITDEVLVKLGLPTNVPTTDPTRRAIDVAPTVLGDGPHLRQSQPLQTSPAPASASSTLP